MLQRGFEVVIPGTLLPNSQEGFLKNHMGLCKYLIAVNRWDSPGAFIIEAAAMGVLVFANPHRSNMKDLFSPFLFATSTEEVVLKIDEIEADLTLYSTLLQTTEN